MSNMIETNEANFQADVIEAGLPVLVDFYAPWCGPCKMLAPVLDQLAVEFAGRVKIVKVNVDHAQRLAYQYNITGVPTLILFKGGLILDTIVGFASPRDLQARLENAAALTVAPPSQSITS